MGGLAQGLDQPFPAYLTSERGRDEPDRPEAWSSGLRRATRTLLFPGCGDEEELLVELIPHSAPGASVSLSERWGRESGPCFGAVMGMRPCTLGALGVVRTQGDAGRVPWGGDRMPGNF